MASPAPEINIAGLTDIHPTNETTFSAWVTVPEHILNDARFSDLGIEADGGVHFDFVLRDCGTINPPATLTEIDNIGEEPSPYIALQWALYEHYRDALRQKVPELATLAGVEVVVPGEVKSERSPEPQQEPETKKPSLGITRPSGLSKPGERTQSKTSLSM